MRDILKNWEINRRGIPPSSEFTESNKRKFDAGLVAETDDAMGQEYSKRTNTPQDLVLENQRGEARALAEIKRKISYLKARKEELQRQSHAMDIVQGSSKDQPLPPNSISDIENQMTPVPCVKKYKKWIHLMGRKRDTATSICSNVDFDHTLTFVTGKEPLLGNLNMDPAYLSEVYDKLNIGINLQFQNNSCLSSEEGHPCRRICKC